MTIDAKANALTVQQGSIEVARAVEKLVADGEVADHADFACLAHLTRARVTQIMNLLHLAPDIQEEILFLPPGEGERDQVGERVLRPIAAIIDWRKQRKAWSMFHQV